MKTILGYAEHGPHDGIGPFSAIFDQGQRLMYAKDLSECAAVVLWGGSDISPALYGEPRYHNSGPTEPSERDIFEWELCRQAVAQGIPIIGVCRGAQMLCAFAGGKLIQDVSGHHGNHATTCHTGETFVISSCHHQMLYPWDVDHEMLAWSTKKLSKDYQPSSHYTTANMKKPEYEEPEVVWFPEIKGFAIQCHPEWHGGYSGTAPDGQAFNKWVMEQILQHCFVKEVC
jgi:anthranilate/para-aminobenzoate synthase component II